MKYTDELRIGDKLIINTDNPMNSGFREGDIVKVVGITCTGDPIVTSYKGHMDRYIISMFGQTALKRKLKMMGEKCTSLNRYCLSKQEDIMNDDDVLWERKLERLGL